MQNKIVFLHIFAQGKLGDHKLKRSQTQIIVPHAAHPLASIPVQGQDSVLKTQWDDENACRY